MKRIAVLITLLVFGCAYPGTPPPSVCDQPAAAGSVICAACDELGVQAEDVDLLLQIAALRALDEHGRKEALKFYSDVEKVLLITGSYRELIAFVQAYVDITGPEILIISRYLPAFDSTELISDFDRGLLLAHIEHAKELLE